MRWRAAGEHPDWVRAEAHMRRQSLSSSLPLPQQRMGTPLKEPRDSGQQPEVVAAGEKELVIPGGDEGWQVYSCT